MRRFEIRVDGEFSAAHQIRLYDGSLEPLHGHNWKVELYIRAERLDGMGVVADFNVIKQRLDKRLLLWHNCFLNERPEFADRNPTTEHVAETLFADLGQDLPDGVLVRRVRVWETRTCAAACEDGEE